MADKETAKIEKKLAKARAKAIKKGKALDGPASAVPAPVKDSSGKTPAERSAEAAERQLVFHRWKVIFGAISALIALVSLIILLWRG